MERKCSRQLRCPAATRQPATRLHDGQARPQQRLQQGVDARGEEAGTDGLGQVCAGAAVGCGSAAGRAVQGALQQDPVPSVSPPMAGTSRMGMSTVAPSMVR